MKKELRQTVLNRMKKLSGKEKEQADSWLTQRLLSSVAYQEAQVMATYLSMPHEVSTAAFIKQAQLDGKRVLVPKTYGQGRMIFVDYDESRLQKSSFGLMEPTSEEAVEKAEIDLIHVPGVVFNSQGFRIGYGGGYYDRYLADFTGASISSIYSFQKSDFEPNYHDIAVKEVLIYELHLR
ncbi:5-formyltetrahydrofolate cyclo-ligase [Streptococcus sanguinis]|jgi:5-formyltetrahydrofolate cyclo-ligase|uniref:5-formyltetrahydrofolate cyclo-ligase n=1 Tax=Streptococcus sanguinis TaxID=1305 RepID=UPI0022844F39|nr:5-formyltetrahydrofolate cyclo-ligase [Streptococcus sanguinis]MCY7017764.1 5-formyltetrahydrofolate cyclo-ligase [Streptococcus sanguinis]